MRLVPFDNFYIKTRLNLSEVQSRLEQEIGPAPEVNFKSLFSSASSATYFEGYVVNGNFDIKRNINYRNSFLPQIIGTSQSVPYGSQVHVKMKLQNVVLIFMCFWLGIVGVTGLGILIPDIINLQFKAVGLIPIGMFLFGYALALGGYIYERNDAKAKLLQFCRAKPWSGLKQLLVAFAL